MLALSVKCDKLLIEKIFQEENSYEQNRKRDFF